MRRIGGSLRNWACGLGGGNVEIPPSSVFDSNHFRNPEVEPCQAGSLTGAVASKKVTEAPKGSLRMVGNHSQSVKA